MKKCCLIIGLCLSSLCSIHAQSTLKFIVDKEGKLFAIPSETNYEIKVPEATYKSYTSVSEQNRRLQEKYAEAYRLMGIAQLQMKKDKEACASFAKAKELGDPNVDALIEKHCK